MKKALLWILFAVVVVTILVVNVKREEETMTSKSGKPVLKLGAVLPLTGDNANVGEDVRDGAILAIEEMKGTLPFDVRFIYEDDQMIASQTNSAALKLLQVDHVDTLFSIWSPPSNIISPHTDRLKTPLICAASWDVDPLKKFHWTLINGSGTDPFAKECVKIMQRHGAKRLAIAAMVQTGNQKILRDMQPYLKQAGIEVVFDEQFPPGTRDFRTYVLKIREAKPDFLLCLSFPPEDEIFWRAYKILGDPIATTGYYDYIGADVRKFVEGAVFPAVRPPEKFNQKFQARFNRPPSVVDAGSMYDMVKMELQTVDGLYHKLGRMPTHEELLTALKIPRKLENLSFGSEIVHPDGWIECELSLLQIKEGKIIDYQSKN
jgi:branched-chain amino acid transport system substrate-binding protein